MLEGNNMKMKAVLLNKTGSPKELKVSEIDIPKIKKDWVLVKVIGFGINRSEIILRQYEANEDYINLPIVPGIELVGEVVNPSNTNFKENDKVIGLMGGMGRSFNGSYAEYCLVPRKNLFKIKDEVLKKLSMENIIAIPETFFTAFESIKTLKLKNNESLLIRGGTSTLGLASIKIADAIGCKIIATSRKEDKLEYLKEKGAEVSVIDDGILEGKISCDKVLELIGPKTLEDSMKLMNNEGVCCVTGILGGIEYINNFDPIKLIPNNKYLTSFFSNYPTQKTIDDLFDFIMKNHIEPDIGCVFSSLDSVPLAHHIIENNEVQGKIIFKLRDV